eukprot:8432236-Lingulodinium_polyedra.AAC.1
MASGSGHVPQDQFPEQGSLSPTSGCCLFSMCATGQRTPLHQWTWRGLAPHRRGLSLVADFAFAVQLRRLSAGAGHSSSAARSEMQNPHLTIRGPSMAAGQ